MYTLEEAKSEFEKIFKVEWIDNESCLLIGVEEGISKDILDGYENKMKDSGIKFTTISGRSTNTETNKVTFDGTMAFFETK